MLGHMQAIEACLVGELGEAQALVKDRGERTVASLLDMIEKSDFHVSSGSIVGVTLTGSS